MSNLKKTLISVGKGYTPKDLFKLKLTGEAVNVLRKTLARELDEWLVERKIFESTVDFTGSRKAYRCLYPTRIWHVNGRGGNEQIMVDHLKPGDLWTF